MQSMQSMGPGPYTPPKKKIHPVVWVLIVLVGLLLLTVIALVGIGYYVAQKFEADPAKAAAVLLSTIDTGFEVVSSDSSSGKLVLRDKSTGKITTFNLNDLKNSSFNFGNNGGEITIEDGERRIVIGGGKAPGWVPAYHDARVKRTIESKGIDGVSGSQTFQTSDGASRVLEFYEQELSKAGLQTTREGGTTLVAKDATRSIEVETTMEGDGSRVILSYTAKD